jgi:hypothetical protein
MRGDDSDSDLDEDQIWKREQHRDLVASRRGIRPKIRIECRDCGTQCPSVKSSNGKWMLLQPGTGRTYAFLEERPGGDFIAVSSPHEGFVVRNDHTAQDICGYAFFEHHDMHCPVRAPRVKRARAQRRRDVKRKFVADIPIAPPADWDLDVRARDDR